MRSGYLRRMFPYKLSRRLVTIATIGSTFALFRIFSILVLSFNPMDPPKHPHVALIYYIKRPSVCVCVCLSVPLFFRHDRRTATKFGTQMRFDLGIIRTETNLTHPTPEGPMGDFRGSKIQNSRKFNFNPPPPDPYPTRGGGLVVNI